LTVNESKTKSCFRYIPKMQHTGVYTFSSCMYLKQ
jgi:hypothetical protein